MTIELCQAPFDPWHKVASHQSEHCRAAGFGATAVFVGSMRDFNEGEPVREMLLEHYPGMTERQLEAIVADCCAQHEMESLLVAHRVGTITPGEPIVLVAVWSAHRAEAFTVCRALMEALKQRAPFWKREHGDQGTRWVSGNTPAQPAATTKDGAGRE